MNIFEGLDKLITERGSAAVLEKHIALLKDSYTALERQLAKSKAEKLELEGFNSALRTEVETLRAEIEQIRRLQHEADEQRQQQLAGGDVLPVDRAAVLHEVCLSEDREAVVIAERVKTTEQKALWHLEQLLAQKLVMDMWSRGGWDSPKARRTWHVTAAGRDALAALDLL